MKYCIVTLLLVCAVSAAPANENAEADVQSAQFGMNQFNAYNAHLPYYYPGMYKQNSMDYGSEHHKGALNPEKYMSMKDEDFPVDYSLQCSNSCGCRQTCTVIWWQPCTCRCPPPCGCNGCIWGCCGNTCCNQGTTSTTTPTTTTTTPTTTTTVTTTRAPDAGVPTNPPCNGGSCCNSCSCMPCMMPIFWMCPPRCGGGCCGGSSNSCCNGTNNSCCNNNTSNCCNGSNNSCCGK
ncbi:hypothetical protein ACKWTF_013714 [Chironomus riparius]